MIPQNLELCTRLVMVERVKKFADKLINTVIKAEEEDESKERLTIIMASYQEGQVSII